MIFRNKLAQAVLGRGLSRAGSLLFTAVCAASLALPFILRFNFDAAWLVYVADRVLHGDRLYVDVIENNPPLIVWLSMPPVIVARVTGLSMFVSFQLWVLLFMGVSVALAAAVLRVLLSDAGELRSGILLLLPVALIGFAGQHFGEREHLMLLCVLPYILLAASRSVGGPVPRRLAISVGAFALVGIALKPFFVLLPLGVEGYLAFRRSWSVLRRPESSIIAVGLVLYSAAVLLFMPEYLPVLRLTRQTYGALDADLSMLVASREVFLPLGLMALSWFLPVEAEFRGLRSVLSVAVVAFVAAAVIQRKGFPYHFYPAFGAAVVIAGGAMWSASALALSSRLDREPVRMLGPVVLAIAIFLTGGWYIYLSSYVFKEQLLAPVVSKEAGGGAVLFLSTDMADAFPLVTETGVRLASPTPSLWILPGFYPGAARTALGIVYHVPRNQAPLERWLVDAVVTRAVAECPALIIVNVDSVQPGFGGAFDYMGYFRQDPRFANLLRGYRFSERTGPFAIYGRRDPSSCRPTEGSVAGTP